MFTKRLAVIVLIAQGYSTYSIAKTLAVSDSTVRSIQKQAKSGKFDVVIGAVTRKDFDREDFLKTLDVLLRCGLPPRGRGRWDLLRKSLKR